VIGAGSAGALALAGCTESGGGNGGNGNGNGENVLSGSIDITGSSTVFPLAQAVSEEFNSEYPDAEVEFNINPTGSGGGFSNFFCPGDSDINNASREITEGEIESCQSNDVEPLELRVATDALTVIVNNENDWATELTYDQLTQIFGPDASEGQTWADIDSSWPEEPIERYGSATTSGTFDFFTEEVVGEGGSHTQDYQPTEQDRSIVQGVQGSPYAIGYFGFSYYYNNPEAATAVAISEEGEEFVTPSLDTAGSGEYPLSRPLFTYPNANRLDQDHIAEFCRFFVESSTDEAIVADEVGYVPNGQDTADEQLGKLEDAIENANA
jgi:phosphate transport system substrate-binding protein